MAKSFVILRNIYPIIVIFVCVLASSISALCQEENAPVVVQGNRYVDFKIKKLAKYNSRLESQQKHILNQLQKKEKRFASKLKRKDSLSYVRYQQQSLSYDSIKTLSESDTGHNLALVANTKNKSIDSLKKIQSFIESKSGTEGINTNKTAELDRLKGQLNYKNRIGELLTKRTQFLKSLAPDGVHLPGLKGIEKQVFYSKGKMKVFKDMEEEPTLAEDKAMEYLQGSAGFDKYMSSTGGGQSVMQSVLGKDAKQLEQMGYQTKQQMQKSMEGKFGSNLGDVSKQMGGSMAQWQEQQKKIGELKQTRQALKQVGSIDKPSFKVNPMRGLPFFKRLERQYSWQTSRAANAAKPALFEASAMLGFKHTPRLTYGVGLAYTEGLGQDWQHIHLSFQGIGYRTFGKWEWQYGIGVYVGYERVYKSRAFYADKPQETEGIATRHNTQKYTESVLIGLSKKYNINTKYNGAIQVLYDIWWQQKGLRSPIVLRFVTVKK